jgi:tetratricopeptide (TPR) repeat protein
MTAYQRDLERIDRDLETLLNPEGTEEITRRVYRLYQRAALTGRLTEFAATEAALEDALGRVGTWSDLCLVKANLAMKFHRLAEVKRALAMSPGLAESFPGRVIRADIDLQEGRYRQAREAYQALIAEDRTWDNLARSAYWESKFGETAEAERIYLEAEDELTAKDMRGYAWVELQLGLLDLRAGRNTEAADHYHRAGAAYTGYWLVDEHMAEMLGTVGKYDEAIRLYERVLQETPRPELQQAFGELYVAMGEQKEADVWFDRALDGFLSASEHGGVHYYHHLVDFYSDVREDAPRAVKWAMKDYDLRPNYATEAALGWALYRDGRIRRAERMMDQALASGVRDAHLFAKAATVKAAAGRMGASDSLSRQAFAMNPHHDGFHVHRA